MSKLIKSPTEIERIRRSAKILAALMRRLKNEAKAGVRLVNLERLARAMIDENGATSTFLGYRPEWARFAFPYTLCTSVNEVIVHGRPSSYVLQSGDLLKLDLGINWQGGISDAAVTIPIGRVSPDAKRLIKITKNALGEAIRVVKPGNTVGDIGHAIERVISSGGGKIIEELTGHGVGLEVHEDPIIYNYGQPGAGLKLREGMVLAIEPMTSLTTGSAVQLVDDSFVTADNSLSAHFEHTVLVTKKGAEILTD